MKKIEEVKGQKRVRYDPIIIEELLPCFFVVMGRFAACRVRRLPVTGQNEEILAGNDIYCPKLRIFWPKYKKY
ncbi:hypothetical protein [Fictibacillus sp. KU28468]|uniref:hypothetical protein n=1 Tax=Fictibacillus sp. KU28468 TaxID=2991053 RepID=UPI00223D07EB|nr:hypothetical protein [Fictibacillus sp. KU28468]UZJ79800.1 hypothetical protein OKX00_04820 [Fictibacillus sp. KU28468]